MEVKIIETILVFIAIIVIILLVIDTRKKAIKRRNRQKDNIQTLNNNLSNNRINYTVKEEEINELLNYNFFGKVNYKLLTNNEHVFFTQLKRITDKYNLLLFPKIRLADIFTTRNEWDFKKVSSKHVDFTICNKYSRPLMFIELDDNSHNAKAQQIRDAKKDRIFECANIELIRIKVNEINLGLYNIEKKLQKICECEVEKSNQMKQIKVITTTKKEDFERELAKFISNGFKVLQSNIAVSDKIILTDDEIKQYKTVQEAAMQELKQNLDLNLSSKRNGVTDSIIYYALLMKET